MDRTSRFIMTTQPLKGISNQPRKYAHIAWTSQESGNVSQRSTVGQFSILYVRMENSSVASIVIILHPFIYGAKSERVWGTPNSHCSVRCRSAIMHDGQYAHLPPRRISTNAKSISLLKRQGTRRLEVNNYIGIISRDQQLKIYCAVITGRFHSSICIFCGLSGEWSNCCILIVFEQAISKSDWISMEKRHQHIRMRTINLRMEFILEIYDCSAQWVKSTPVSAQFRLLD